MNELVGSKVGFVLTGMNTTIVAVVVRVTNDLVYVKGEDGTISRIIKNKICVFKPMGLEPEPFLPIHVLFCENFQAGCRGVQHLKAGKVVNAMFDKFMAGCPCRTDQCMRGTKGDLHSADPKYLMSILDGLLLGEFPKEKTE